MFRLLKNLLRPIYRIFFKYYVLTCLRLSIPMPLVTSDRRILEGPIFQWLNKISSNGNLLFIGCAPYTSHYYRQLNYTVYTIDSDPGAARYGKDKFHTIGSGQNLNIYYESNFFDVILAYGLIGYGLNTKNDFDLFLKSCSESMVIGGVLMIGYNNNQSHLDFKLSDVDAYNFLLNSRLIYQDFLRHMSKLILKMTPLYSF